jgi:hypothetical protein
MKQKDKKHQGRSPNKDKKASSRDILNAIKKVFNASEKILALISIPLSIITIFLTFQSIRNQKIIDSYNIREFSAERNLILKIVSIEKDSRFTVSPTQDDLRIQSCQISYPTSFPVDMANYFPQSDMISFNYFFAQNTINEFIKQLPTHPTNNFAVIPEFVVPTVFSCDYIAKGERFDSIGFYYLQFTLTIGNATEEPIIEFKGMRFVGTISNHDEATKLLNELWELSKSSIIDSLKGVQ